MPVLVGIIAGLLFVISVNVENMADDIHEIRNIEVSNYNDRIAREEAEREEVIR